MAHHRILSLWFPRLGAERILRRTHIDGPFAIIKTRHNAQTLSSLCAQADGLGLSVGQSLSDARTLCPNLTTQAFDAVAEEQFLKRLHRWASKFTPWISIQEPDSLMLDISGCAHLFGGEKAMADLIFGECARLRITAQIGVADTLGAAWALARFAGHGARNHRTGDAVQQEARATRSRAFKRRGWERGGAAPLAENTRPKHFIAPPTETLGAIAPLPLQALRLAEDTIITLNRLGIRSISELANLPRGSVSRRFGAQTLRRLDQALGIDPEPVCPAKPAYNFATRLSFPDPIGLANDITEGIMRLTPPLCEKLRNAGMGVRCLQLSLFRADHSVQMIEVSLARPSHDQNRMLPLLTLRLPTIEPGYGIDMMRLEAVTTEPIRPEQHAGHAEALETARKSGDEHMDLLGRLGTRIGLEELKILHPANSHLPEHTTQTQPATFSDPAGSKFITNFNRPTIIFPPEAITPLDKSRPPNCFKWRNIELKTNLSSGPERIAPEWWLELPEWRNGTRDYWRVTTDKGLKLWIYQAHGDVLSGGWFCHGDFG